ncbi:hypothetical protein HYV81_05250 [Candidatus Woesearchaeota archaeon]|nr:hypothetical protein [Candidatus Woesearchaeota archaeon]
MRIALITSRPDPASMNMRQRILQNFEFRRSEQNFAGIELYEILQGEARISLYTLEKRHIFVDNLHESIDADLFVVLSTHRSESKKPALTVHSIGNFGKAEHGGMDRAICETNALFIRNYFLALQKRKHEVLGYDITMEATHHGPYIEKPLVYVEIGATEKEWQDAHAARIAVECVMETIGKLEAHGIKVAAGIGGLHYCDNFNRFVEKHHVAFAYVCPKYAIKHLTIEMLQQMQEKGKVDFFLLDWKGLGQDKQFLLDLLEKSGVAWKRNDQYQEV